MKQDTFVQYRITEDTQDIDRKIQQIRQGIEAEKGAGFNTFYDADIYKMWNPSDSPPTDGGESEDGLTKNGSANLKRSPMS